MRSSYLFIVLALTVLTVLADDTNSTNSTGDKRTLLQIFEDVLSSTGDGNTELSRRQTIEAKYSTVDYYEYFGGAKRIFVNLEDYYGYDPYQVSDVIAIQEDLASMYNSRFSCLSDRDCTGNGFCHVRMSGVKYCRCFDYYRGFDCSLQDDDYETLQSMVSDTMYNYTEARMNSTSRVESFLRNLHTALAYGSRALSYDQFSNILFMLDRTVSEYNGTITQEAFRNAGHALGYLLDAMFYSRFIYYGSDAAFWYQKRLIFCPSGQKDLNTMYDIMDKFVAMAIEGFPLGQNGILIAGHNNMAVYAINRASLPSATNKDDTYNFTLEIKSSQAFSNIDDLGEDIIRITPVFVMKHELTQEVVGSHDWIVLTSYVHNPFAYHEKDNDIDNSSRNIVSQIVSLKIREPLKGEARWKSSNQRIKIQIPKLVSTDGQLNPMVITGGYHCMTRNGAQDQWSTEKCTLKSKSTYYYECECEFQTGYFSVRVLPAEMFPFPNKRLSGHLLKVIFVALVLPLLWLL